MSQRIYLFSECWNLRHSRDGAKAEVLERVDLEVGAASELEIVQGAEGPPHSR